LRRNRTFAVVLRANDKAMLCLKEFAARARERGSAARRGGDRCATRCQAATHPLGTSESPGGSAYKAKTHFYKIMERNLPSFRCLKNHFAGSREVTSCWSGCVGRPCVHLYFLSPGYWRTRPYCYGKHSIQGTSAALSGLSITFSGRYILSASGLWRRSHRPSAHW